MLAVSLLAGCGSDDPEVEAAAPTSSEATEPAPTVESEEAETVTTEPDTALHAQEVALDASVWWTRHRFDLGTARVEPEDGGGYLRVEVDPPEAASGDLWTFEPKAVILQPQGLWSGYPVDAGQALLVIDMAIAVGDSASRPLQIGTGDFTLTLPDGIVAAAPGDGYPGINEAVSPGAVTPEVSMAFNVPLDATGDYMLSYEDESGPIQMKFSIE